MQSSLKYDSELIKNKFRKASATEVHTMFDEEDTDNNSTINSK